MLKWRWLIHELSKQKASRPSDSGTKSADTAGKSSLQGDFGTTGYFGSLIPKQKQTKLEIGGLHYSLAPVSESDQGFCSY